LDVEHVVLSACVVPNLAVLAREFEFGFGGQREFVVARLGRLLAADLEHFDVVGVVDLKRVRSAGLHNLVVGVDLEADAFETLVATFDH